MIDIHQPVSDLQLQQLTIEWKEHSSVGPNDYNPNEMDPPERSLLIRSILEDGWTQPIVVQPDGTIVDGEQRWTVAGLALGAAEVQAIIDDQHRRKADGYTISESILERLEEARRRLTQVEVDGGIPSIAQITGGLVPVTVLAFGDRAHSIISTIRHNRARGVHRQDAMGAIVRDLVAMGVDFTGLAARLGMDFQEADRFLRAEEGPLAELAQLAQEPFSPSWAPVHVSELTDAELTARGLTRSENLSASGNGARVRKVTMRVFAAEKTEILAVLGGDNISAGLVRLCRVVEAHRAVFDRWVLELSHGETEAFPYIVTE